MKTPVRVLVLMMFPLFILMGSCNPTPKRTEASIIQPELSMRNPVVKKVPKVFKDQIRYTKVKLEDRDQVDSLFNSVSEIEKQNILALNRIQKNRVRPGNFLILPECSSRPFNQYAPFPDNIQSLECMPKSVLISKRIQAFALYEKGELIRWGPVSTGKSSTRTPSGLNYGNYKAERKVSTVDPSWILPYYFNFMNFEGIGVHQYALPGFPASHGCVRLQMKDAKFIYDWAENWEISKGTIVKNGTPFLVYGEYDYEREKPWLQLSIDMRANDLNQDELELIANYVDQFQQDSRNFEEKTSLANSELATL